MFAFSSVSSTSFIPRSGRLNAAFSTNAVSLSPRKSRHAVSISTPSMALDPHSVAHISHSVHTTFSHLLASSATTTATASSSSSSSLISPLQSLTHLLSNAAAVTADAAGTAAATTDAATKTGIWGSFVKFIESAIVLIHSGFVSAGVPGAYGLSIITFTFIVKAITFPLNYRQMESTMKMQAIAPRLRKIQADYKDNPALMQQMTADLYRKQNVNPLAGCFPVFAQIPVWVALYRSVLNLASENLLNEGFLWLPSLQGPVSSTGQGLDTWLYPFVDGHPPIGWHDALCYILLPIILMANQYVTTKLITPQPTDDSQQQQAANNFLKFMPLLIGWFSLNVPSGLGVYWVTNNMLSTLQTLYIRSKFPPSSLTIDDDDDTDAIDVSASADGFSSTPPPSSSPAAITKSAKGSKKQKRRKRR